LLIAMDQLKPNRTKKLYFAIYWENEAE